LTSQNENSCRAERRKLGIGRFAFTAWHGMALDTWLGLMKGKWKHISPIRYPAVAVIFVMTSINLVRKWISRALYGRKLSLIEVSPDPIFVIGHWRSGTTWLHQTLVGDPAFAAPDMRACFNPEAFLAGRRILAPILPILFPKRRPMDNVPISTTSAEEDEWGIALAGGSSAYIRNMFPLVPLSGSAGQLDQMTNEEAVRWRTIWLNFLRAVQFVNPGKWLVLKSPSHTARCREILKLFPNAKFIHIVRDPYRIFASSRKSYIAMFASQSLDDRLPSQAAIDKSLIQNFVDLHVAYHATKDQIPDGQLITIRYEDLKSDTPGTIRRIYETLDLGDYDRVAAIYEAKARRSSSYKTNKFTLDAQLIEMVDENWTDYFERYGYSKMSDRLEEPA
jgi:omega-hydroxy-beta-dihydromenaquinone-9 sulfotransferase